MPASSPTGVEMKAIVAKGLSTPYGTEDLREALRKEAAGDYDCAEKILQAATQEFPDSADAHFHLSRSVAACSLRTSLSTKIFLRS
jgi:hypothetical protein